ncbi:hypothetical protein [Streptomyces diastatochromogenes]|uniref:Uncharacterized protein n=1 Tax=Streptomyces diastatochromogenes TaxID=42236 RepID=A0A233S8H6_STRDA|nr:hypothetical protein [Streptomyces diastatochromogenes]MCZ0990390.1 hypothetical protein [Streptomyces diastatochromogenes]OXY91884.1 hypothetical protein BEK98_27675 [Streptomyces diastatochromogenes]
MELSGIQGHMRVQEHAEKYVARHGRHPYTDCWPWAEAALAWSRANEQQVGWWSLRNADLFDDDIEHLPAAIAETFRLSMVRHNRAPGDLNLDNALLELGYWATGRNYPDAGTPGWPQPTGPYAARWQAAFLPSDPERAERLAIGAEHVLRGLLFHTAKSPHRSIADDYRLRVHGITYIALADTAPLIGITTPVEVRDPLSYQGIEGLTAVPLPDAA